MKPAARSFLIPVLYYEMCWIYLGGVELRLHLFWVVDVHFIEPWDLFEILRSAFQVQPCQMGHLQGWDHQHPEAECFGLDRVFKGCQRVKKQICIYIYRWSQLSPKHVKPFQTHRCDVF